MRWWLLGVACLLSVALFVTGCAAHLVDVGRIYYVVWPGQKPDIVEIHRIRRDGWAQCRSVEDTVVYMCNLNTATYFVRVRPNQPDTALRTD